MRDDELDAALSSLTAVEPDPLLADRVLRAIRKEPAPRARTWPALAGLAAAATLAISTGVAWVASRPASLPPAVSPAPASSAPLSAPDPWAAADALGRAAGAASSSAVAPAHAAGRGQATAARRAAAEDESWRLPPLERSEPLAIPAIVRASLEEPQLAIEPLSVDQLEIESLER